MKRIRRLLQEPQRPRTSAAPTFVVGLLVVSAGVAAAGWQIKPTGANTTFGQPGRESIAVQGAASVAGIAPQHRGSAAPRLLNLIARAEAPQDQTAPQSSQEKLRIRGQGLYFQGQVLQSTQDLSQADRQILRDALSQAQEAIRTYNDTPYKKWLNEDVAYIISDEERSAFKRLQADEEQEHFIEQFWLRRDPTPGTTENEMRDEHYRRIAYANAHFASQIAGWKTDRGRIYIIYGPADEIDSHPSGGSYQPGFGAPITTAPFEKWTYRFIQDVGNNVVIEFVDKDRNGEFRQTADPNDKDALLFRPPSPLTPPSMSNGSNRGTNLKVGTTVQILGTPTTDGRAVMISVPLNMFGTHKVDLIGTITPTNAASLARNREIVNSDFGRGAATTTTVTDTQQAATSPITFQLVVQAPLTTSTRIVSLKPGTYHIKIMLRDIETGALASDDIDLEVK